MTGRYHERVAAPDERPAGPASRHTQWGGSAGSGTLCHDLRRGSLQESRHRAAARAEVCKVEIDKGFQPLRNIRVDLSGPAAPSLDGSFMLIGPAREFGSAPAEDDQTAFKAIGGHVSILNTFD